MIQRFLFLALTDGIAQIQADPTLLEQLFEDLYELDPDEVEGIKTVFAAKPPKVIHGYSPRDVDPPMYSIVLKGEQETETFLNNDAPQVTDVESPDFGADVKTSIWQHNYLVFTYSEHPDVTGYYYEIAKSILLASTDFFADRDLFDISLSGQDLAPDPNYLPEHLFARALSFQCERQFTRVDRDSKAGKAFQVGGIHIDKAGSPSDVGGVKTLMTPISPEDLDG
jgi:hypothetical protein